LYVSGWLKRGPTGIIATNIIDAKETVSSIIADIKTHKLSTPAIARTSTTSTIDEILRIRGLQIVDTAGWRRIEAAENAAGQTKGKPREKFVDLKQMLAVATAVTPARPVIPNPATHAPATTNTATISANATK
jgi:NADPH-dependent glutamate synthase beta subunit-like oxidoreductase